MTAFHWRFIVKAQCCNLNAFINDRATINVIYTFFIRHKIFLSKHIVEDEGVCLKWLQAFVWVCYYSTRE